MRIALAAAAAMLLFAVPAHAQRATFPPHHRLWLCIHAYEGSWNSRAGQTGPGQYGGLQMSWNWLGYIHGNAGNMAQADQEWAAERAWAANGYRYSFLYGQWYAWDAADGCGTTG